jgi:hypothetical protein
MTAALEPRDALVQSLRSSPCRALNADLLHITFREMTRTGSACRVVHVAHKQVIGVAANIEDNVC